MSTENSSFKTSTYCCSKLPASMNGDPVKPKITLFLEISSLLAKVT